MKPRLSVAILAASLLAFGCADPPLPASPTSAARPSSVPSASTSTATVAPDALDAAWEARTVLRADARAFGRGTPALAAAHTAWTEDERGRWTPAEDVEDVDATQRLDLMAWRGGFVSWDFGNVIRVSPDGLAWSDARVQPDEGNPAAIVPFGDELLFLGQATQARVGAWRSTDGSIWERVDGAPTGIAGATSAGAGGIVAVGSTVSGTAAWVTPDGVTWSAIPPPGPPPGQTGGLFGVASGTGRVVVIGDVNGAAAVWSSGDLTHWTRSAQPAREDEFLQRVVNIDGLFAIAGRRHDRPVMWWSADGLTWASVELPLAADLDGEVSDVIADDGRVIAFGWTTEDAGNGGSFRTGYLVWTLDIGR